MKYIILFVVLLVILFFINNEKKKTLIFYSNPNCIHCSNFKPMWSDLIKKDNRVIYKFVDDPEICAKNNITSFPTLRLYSGIKYVEYEGERTIPALSRFISS